jgi:tRNA(Ile)-lysidine synthase
MMLDAFLNYITRENLFASGDRILLAVSGGMDSVAMAELFYMAGFDFGIAHCNFALRGDESDADEVFVKAMADKMRVPVHVKRFKTRDYAREHHLSIQMAARELRYEWFDEIRHHKRYVCVATAHHGDDRIETFFINLVRGTGLSGLRGILPKQGAIIHPLLFTFRNEIEKFIRENDLAYRTDVSNASDKYLRNRIRHHIIPELEKIDPLFRRSITATIERIRDAEQVYHMKVDEGLEKIVVRNDDTVTVSIPELQSLVPVDCYLFELLSPFGFNDSTINQIRESLGSSSGKQFLSVTHRVIKDRGHLVIVRKKSSLKKSMDQIFIDRVTTLLDDPVKLKLTVIEDVRHYTVTDNPDIAGLDYDKLSFPLQLRKWRQGDFFYPLGLKKRKKLSDFFIDEKLSIVEKERTWLVVSGDDIVWIVGRRIDHRYRITNHTERVYEIELLRPSRLERGSLNNNFF